MLLKFMIIRGSDTFFYNAQDAEKAYRRDYGLRYKHITWNRPVY